VYLLRKKHIVLDFHKTFMKTVKKLPKTTTLVCNNQRGGSYKPAWWLLQTSMVVSESFLRVDLY